MGIEVGEVTVDEEGNATGSGLAYEIFVDILAEIDELSVRTVAERVAPFCEGLALAISRYLYGEVPYLAQMGPPQFAGLTSHRVEMARGSVLLGSGSHTVLDRDGAGYLSRIFMTIAGTDDALIRESRLQIYVDGEETPSVDVQFQHLCCFRGPNSSTYPGDIVTSGAVVSLQSGCAVRDSYQGSRRQRRLDDWHAGRSHRL